jgi:hypothetical protein
LVAGAGGATGFRDATLNDDVTGDRRVDAMRTPLSGAGYLSLKQVRDLWEAASFLVQMYGLFLNTRISIRYGRLGIDDPSKVGPFLTSLMHELRMLINGRAASAECPEPFHWQIPFTSAMSWTLSWQISDSLAPE